MPSPATIDSATLAGELEHFLAGSRDAQVVEDGRVLFDLRTASYSISGERGKALLHIWSQERNIVRRVLECENRRGLLKLTVQRFGQAKLAKLEIVQGNDSRSPSARKTARAAYEELLQRLIEREFIGYAADRLRSTMDLEHSFSPVYARGLVRKGRSAFAVLGCNASEQQAAVDGSLTFGILWLDHCRKSLADRAYVEGLKLLAPSGCSDVVRERMANLDHRLAKFELYEVNERERSLRRIDCLDRGNISTRLVHCVNETAAQERLAKSRTRMNAIAAGANVGTGVAPVPAAQRLSGASVAASGETPGPTLSPPIQTVPLSAAELSFRVNGLEFARARYGADPRSFGSSEEIVFGVGAAAHVLDQQSEPLLQELLTRIVRDRHARGDHSSPFWRMTPERWLEALVIRNVSALDSRLFSDDALPVYSQVPAFSSSDRAMIDVLTLTRERRLAVIELKADEDLHLPLQGLDYWARVAWHQQRGEFQRFGYFPGVELSPDPPLLLLVAPALRVHPATDALLRYMSPEIDCELIGIDEHWREQVRVVFRKRRVLVASTRP